jgi:hypothetical protein
MGRYRILDRVAWTRDGTAYVRKPCELAELDDDVAAELGDKVQSLDRPAEESVSDEPRRARRPRPETPEPEPEPEVNDDGPQA